MASITLEGSFLTEPDAKDLNELRMASITLEGSFLTESDAKDLDALKKLCDKVVFDDNRFNGEGRENVVKGVCANLISAITGQEDVDIEYYSGSHLVKFASVVSLALVTGYWQGFPNDIAKRDREEFGFSGFERLLKVALIVSLDGREVKDDEIKQTVEDGLLIKLRDISVSEYIATVSLWRSDLEYLFSLFSADEDDGYNVQMLNAIEKDATLKSIYTDKLDEVMGMYNLVFADAFGLKPFYGVLGEQNKFYTLVHNYRNSTKALHLTEAEGVLNDIYGRVLSQIKDRVHISSCRQFDYDEIYDSKTKVVYFPRKILEYAFGRKSTLNILQNVYQLFSEKSIGWKEYAEGYVKPNVEKILIRGMYHALERVTKRTFTELDIPVTDESYSSYVAGMSRNVDIKNAVSTLLGKLRDSMINVYLLPKFVCLNDEVASLSVRVSMKSDQGKLNGGGSATKDLLFGVLSDNVNLIYPAPIAMSLGVVDARNRPLCGCIYEYQFDANPIVAEAEPLFGYKVQNINRQKGVSAGWKNILLGRTPTGADLYASESSSVRLQSRFIHNIFAGSRAGKGVMTMNLLANAFASGKPVFYLDNKPDMASLFYHLSGGAMFTVNGGGYSPKDEYPGVKPGYFDEDAGPAMVVWRNMSKPYLEAHPGLLEMFGVSSATYTGTLGQYVYLRAALFCLGLVYVRFMAPNSAFVQNELNGTDGITIVFDEFTSYQGGIMSLFTPKGPVAAVFGKIGGSAGYENKRLALQDQIDELRAKMTDKNAVTIEPKIARIEEKIKLLSAFEPAYAAMLFKKLKSCYDNVSNWSRKAFKNEEKGMSDIFVLGQDFQYKPMVGVPTEPYFYEEGKGGGVFLAKGGQSIEEQGEILRGMLNTIGYNDWFLGANSSNGVVTASLESSGSDYKWVEEKKNWVYAYDGEGVVYTDITAPKKPFSGKTVQFKPYLVLNLNSEGNPAANFGNLEAKIHGSTEFTYVEQCVVRIESAAPGLWSKVRREHLLNPDDETPNTLVPGVGFQGLVAETLATTERGHEMSQEQLMQFASEAFAKSGIAATKMARLMGYQTWQELIYDFSPTGLFDFDDMLRAVQYNNGDKYRQDVKSRLPVFVERGIPESGDIQDVGEGSFSAPEYLEEDGFDDAVHNSGEAVVDKPNSDPTFASEVHQSGSLTAEEATRLLYGSDSQADPEDDGYSDWDDGSEDSGFAEESTSSPVNMSQDSFAIARDMVKYISGLVLQLVSEMQQKTGHVYTEDEVDEIMTLGIEEYRNCMSGGDM